MKMLLLFACLLGAQPNTGWYPADAIVGVWKNNTGKGHIQIYRNGNKYYGKIVWLKEALDRTTGGPKLDMKNADPTRRRVPLVGLVMLRDFTYDDDGWSGGAIYNPSDGREYRAFIKMKDAKTLAVRAFIGVSIIGKTDVWTRVK